MYHFRAMAEFVYDEDVAARYDAAIPIPPGEIELYLGLAREAQAQGLATLELACGTGRIAIPLAREGIDIVGLDNSPEMLARAQDKSVGLKNVRWVEGDMRSADLGERFGLVFIATGTFQLMLSMEDQMACLRCAYDHLAPGGRLAFEIANPDIVAMGEWLTSKRGVLQRNPARDYTHPQTGLHVRAWGTIEYRTSEQLEIRQGLIEELDDDGVVVRRSYSQPMTLRYLYRYETEHLLARCGFEVEALYGDVRKNEYRGSSPAMIWIGRRT